MSYNFQNSFFSLANFTPSIWQLVRFGIVGSFVTVLSSLIFLILVNLLKFEPLLANLCAFLMTFFISYLGHSWWTFKNKTHSPKKLLMFLIFSFAGLCINQIFVWFLMHIMHESAYIATLPMIFVTPLIMFCINKTFIFNKI